MIPRIGNSKRLHQRLTAVLLRLYQREEGLLDLVADGGRSAPARAASVNRLGNRLCRTVRAALRSPGLR